MVEVGFIRPLWLMDAENTTKRQRYQLRIDIKKAKELGYRCLYDLERYPDSFIKGIEFLDDHILVRGFQLFFDPVPLPGFVEVGAWSNGFREVYVHPKDKAIFTACEGDLTLELFKNHEAYKKELRRMKDFYCGKKI